MTVEDLRAGDMIDARALLAQASSRGQRLTQDQRDSARTMLWLVVAVKDWGQTVTVQTSSGDLTVPSGTRVKALRRVRDEVGDFNLV